ncbi:hypothetical protein SPRG_15731 [Saprolegnia parasitica CBS 223.65]|uniref:F-box domain-containing protein n=1 Tax=Saprolegnia parasitica (strain CBS 223.65) TaxID=695850 RepID=A0A067BXM3_SAPPC|nr:hypothetical protein SPRG_15731 [Saprolegnia parasitica CBS 223.65]KDO19066.1 hypothetical protein SPRG_15731 [Saprolegnia parasitica CBS 223.65]|eukprot:XP_012210222.1 hypothetical protein SPRG_15731 [Saprolegnia parasitica CBS 223.65]
MSFDARVVQHYEVDPVSIAAYAISTPFAPRVSVSVGNMAQWTRYVNAIAHLVTSVELDPMPGLDDPIQAAALRDALVACPRLRKLCVRYSDWGDAMGIVASIDCILRAAPSMSRVCHIDIKGSVTVHSLAASSVHSLVQWIEAGEATHLRLHHVNVAIDEGGRDGVGAALASAISRSTTLQTVDLKNVTFFNTQGLVGQPLPATTREFHWASNDDAPRLPTAATLTRHLGASLALASRLVVLRLAGNNTLCPTTLVAELAAVLPHMQHLGSLHLKGNSLQGVDVSPLMAVLPSLPALETLRIKMARLDDAGARALASVLPHCTLLCQLLVQGGAYNEASSEALLTATASMPALDYLEMDVATDCNEGWMQRLSPLLATCATTTACMVLHSVNVSSSACAALASALIDAGLREVSPGGQSYRVGVPTCSDEAKEQSSCISLKNRNLLLM